MPMLSVKFNQVFAGLSSFADRARSAKHLAKVQAWFGCQSPDGDSHPGLVHATLLNGFR
jgi:hypothetical protein